jgi:hypothetical protein
MYRLVVSQVDDRTIRVRCPNKGFEVLKYIHIPSIIKGRDCQPYFSYGLFKALKESMRDILYRDFGKDFRKIEHKHSKSILKSIVGAAKRAKLESAAV